MIPGFNNVTRGIATSLGIPRFVLIAAIVLAFDVWQYVFEPWRFKSPTDWAVHGIVLVGVSALCWWVDRPATKK